MDKLRRALNGNERCDEESGIITQVITFNKPHYWIQYTYKWLLILGLPNVLLQEDTSTAYMFNTCCIYCLILVVSSFYIWTKAIILFTKIIFLCYEWAHLAQDFYES